MMLVVEAGLVLGGLEALLDRPATAGHPDRPGGFGSGGPEADAVGDLVGVIASLADEPSPLDLVEPGGGVDAAACDRAEADPREVDPARRHPRRPRPPAHFRPLFEAGDIPNVATVAPGAGSPGRCCGGSAEFSPTEPQG